MFDVCIIGGGVAGLMLAHSLPPEYTIAVVTKDAPDVGNSRMAQGGIAASLDPSDTPAAHTNDTMNVAADHAAFDRVDLLTRNGEAIMRRLLADGLPHDTDHAGCPLLGMEGAHSTRRILHAGGDQTGRGLMAYLMKKTRGRVIRFAHHQALELLVREGRCYGAVVSDENGHRKTITARHTVLATGGIGALYSHTSNSSVAEGTGLSLAYRAGAVLEDLEFVQFHPTILMVDGASRGLISEAVRGEGARLIDGNGTFIMESIHPDGELAPRDVVARAIERYWQERGPVFLDARGIANFGMKFPSILKNCREHGLDPAVDPLPVRPGAHFHMGGVKTDDRGATNVANLYAIGEVASTGVHGANRLASNSLLEALVFAERLGEFLAEQGCVGNPDSGFTLQTLKATGSPVSLPAQEELQHRMIQSVGILRDKDALAAFVADVPVPQVDDLLCLSDEEIHAFHRTAASSLMATAALLRNESRGAHFRGDVPFPSPAWRGKTIDLSHEGVLFNTREIHSKETVQ
ncbi:L-aspartate oxidase [Planomicrobium sp. YIM 101495]|uniref:L-aspartate oxidase n=1 Tax=Planomicrobium sp. YIM 101495 TaxID=2665160 RepID=UPI0012B96DAB|nr:L-aspartate oxidase [Planomicrobium sp. YIM 101495]MTD30742.1 L-aspartate oxidase [Planomicrobium sp. YIM 101495]